MDYPTTNRFIETNGVRLNVIEAGPKDGELVVLLHGFPEFWYGWRNQIGALAAAGYRVLAPDQRGYNLSDKPRGVQSYAVDKLGNDIVGLIDAAGRDKAIIVGHDWGGGVAWWLALMRPERVSKLVILDSPHPVIFQKMLRGNPRQMLKSWYFLFFNLPWLPEMNFLAGDCKFSKPRLKNSAKPGAFTDEDVERYCESWQQPGAMTAMLNWYRAIVRKPPASPTDIRAHMPTLILWGKRDAFLITDLATQSAALCDNVRVELLDTTHWIQHDEPERVNALLLEFLATKP